MDDREGPDGEAVEWAEAVSGARAARIAAEAAELGIEADGSLLEIRVERAAEWGRAKRAGKGG